MFQLLEALAMRALLKRLKKENLTCLYLFADDGVAYARIARLGFLTVTLDIVDQADEETWLATFSLPISMINSVNLSSVDRARRKFMLEHDGIPSVSQDDDDELDELLGEYDDDEDE